MYIPRKATTKVAKFKVDTVSGTATALLKVPGNGRVIKGGSAWFSTPHADDYIKFYVTDEDNILGLGAGIVVGSYTDGEVPVANEGWYMTNPLVIEAIVSTGFLEPNFYLKIVAVKGDGSADTLRGNIHWGTEP